MNIDTIRPATADDASAIAAIYAPHVLQGTATFEEVPPTAQEMAERIDKLLRLDFPYFVALDGGTVIGYAYAGPHKERSAYRFTVEDSIYIDAAHHGRGIGRTLLAHLIDACRGREYRQLMAVIGDSANHASIGLHKRLGFRHIGVATSIGFKFGRELDVVYMQRPLDE